MPPATPQPKRGSIGIYLVLLAVAIGAMTMLRHCSIPHSPRQRLAGGDTLNVAIEYAPMSLYRYADTLGGFSYDMLRDVAGRRGLTLKFHPMTGLAEAIAGLEQGSYDIVVAEAGRTSALTERVLFTEPALIDRLVLVQMPDSAGQLAVKSQLDLAGRTVAVAKDSPAKERLANLGREIGDTIYVEEHPDYGVEQLVMLTAIGQIPLAAVPERTARKLLADYPGADASVGISFSQLHGWMVARDNRALADTLDAAIRDYKETAAYRALVKRYLK